MKTLSIKIPLGYFFAMIITLFGCANSSIFAQHQKIAEITKNKYALQNIKSGILSENEQVRKSAIYFAGYYRIIETEEILIKQLKMETISEIKILLGLSLYRMNSDEGMKVLKKIIEFEKDLRVKRRGYAIFHEYLNNKLNFQNKS